ncbi:paraquat-inducible protein A [Pirellulales bacterium]|nr:paraquat-inducible protein A [Pirellulales bacterium]
MSHLKSCHCCGLIQRSPDFPGAVCARCETALESWLSRFAGNRLAAAFALAGLFLYLPAMFLPFLRIEQLGQAHESSLLVGVRTLFTEGHLLVGVIVLAFSVVLPVFKLAALLFLSQRRWQLQHRHRAMTYRIVEQLGRWGMLDVLLVAVMVAFIKLGGLVEFGAGPGLIMFALFVLLSLCASAVFDPYCLWDEGMMMSGDNTLASQASASPDDPVAATDSSISHTASPEAKLSAGPGRDERSPAWIWVIPAGALLLAAWVAWSAFMHRGREITISFTDGRGIEAGDELRFHGIVAGKVSRATLADELQGVTVQVRLTPQADRLAREGSRFWIVRPQAGITGVSGLETVMGSKYLTVLPGATESAIQHEFVGLEEPPLPDLEQAGGIEVVLESLQGTGLRPGLGVYYRNVRIGGIIETGLAADGSAVETRVYIRPEGRHLIRRETKFWNAGGVQVTGGLTQFSLHIGTVETIVHGGIAVAVPPAPGAEVGSGARFKLYDQPQEKWLQWKPSVENRLLPMPANLPTLRPATLSWKRDGLVRDSDQQRTGWVLPIDGSLLGPHDLLDSPAGAVEGSVQLQMADEVVPLPGDAEPIGDGVVLRPASGTTLPRNSIKRRRITSPENGFLITGGSNPPLLIAAARYGAKAGGGWAIDKSVPITSAHHGGVIVATKDGAAIGCVIFEDEQARACPVVKQ